MSLHQNNKLLLVHHKRRSVSHWPPASEIGMLLVTNCLELGVVAGISRTLSGRQHAVSGQPILIHTYHAVSHCSHAVTLPRPCRGLERSLSEKHIRGMARERQGNGMACVNQTRPHCVNQTGKTQSIALAERHGMGTAWYGNGTAWERHGMFESV
jgi:hypothetical protein